MPAIRADKDDLLDNAFDRDEQSRLSCHIALGDARDGSSVTIAAEV